MHPSYTEVERTLTKGGMKNARGNNVLVFTLFEHQQITTQFGSPKETQMLQSGFLFSTPVCHFIKPSRR